MFFSSTAIYALPAGEARQKAIDLAMANVESPDLQTPPPPPASIITSPTESPKPTRHQHLIELAFQLYSYDYKSSKYPYLFDQNLLDSGKITKSGDFWGFYGAKTWHLYAPLHSLSEVWEHYEIPNFVRIEGEFGKGTTDYKSLATGTLKGINAFHIDARALLGYDLTSDDVTIYTPYMGIGFMRHTDKAGGWLDFIVHGYGQYHNEYNMLYLPIGLEIDKPINDQWDIDVKLEGDIVVWGQANYDLNEIPGGPFSLLDIDTNQTVNAILKKSESDFRGGFGFRTSCKLIRKFRYFDFYVEPYVRYLYLNQTKHSQVDAYGVDNGKNYVSVYLDGTPYKPLWDPANYTIEVGGRTGIQF